MRRTRLSAATAIGAAAAVALVGCAGTPGGGTTEQPFEVASDVQPTITDRDFTIATIVAPSALKSDEGDTTVAEDEGEGE